MNPYYAYVVSKPREHTGLANYSTNILTGNCVSRGVGREHPNSSELEGILLPVFQFMLCYVYEILVMFALYYASPVLQCFI